MYAEDLEWMQDSACQEISQDVFFAPDPEPARRICLSCSVTVQCLEYALEIERQNIRGGRHGVFGCLTPDERKKAARLIRTGWSPADVLGSLKIRKKGLSSNRRSNIVVSIGRRRGIA